ncbi:MAG: AAA family ATPase [Myxococcota bacterium]
MTEAPRALAALREAVNAQLVGKAEVVDLALTAILAGGHLLLQDIPGVGKTTLARALAAVVGGGFARVQFTSDLLPSDLIGVNVLDPATGSFGFRPGPIFANVVLADEINRTTPKTQSALFEAMEERQVTVDGETRALPSPFFVVATQNPFDAHGTFALPDSQLDRFLMRLSIGYPDRSTERAILRQVERTAPAAVLDPDGLNGLIEMTAQMQMPEIVEEYLLDVVAATRRDSGLVRGVSTRAAQALHRAVRALAVVEGREYPEFEDVRRLVMPVFAHRLMARAGHGPGDVATVDRLRALLDTIPSPL